MSADQVSGLGTPANRSCELVLAEFRLQVTFTSPGMSMAVER